jgi:hypothetical protein
MQRPPEVLKSFADRMARTAAADEAAQLVHLLSISGLMGGDANSIDVESLSEEKAWDHVHHPRIERLNDGNIGVWERRAEGGKSAFVRRLDMMDEWKFWANIGRIEPKGAKRRVLLLGESVARGYLYDPGFNPAMALQMILDLQFGEDQIEVIDLARSNLGYDIRELAIAARELEPDIAVIFAGNNWNILTPTFADVVRIDKALASEGMAGVKRVSEEYLTRAGTRVARDIAAAYKEQGIPLVWIIPEFDLGDWRAPITNAPYLPGDQNAEWLNLYRQAQAALTNGDPETAERLALRMVEIDHGMVVTGFYILAECRQLAHDLDGARKYLELARDATSWDSSMLYVPKPHSITQEILRRESEEGGYQVVDLPALFKDYLNGEIPDRRLFVDYCHLTSKGMQIAMGAAAACILRVLKEVEVPWYALVNDQIAPSNETEAEASFLAAIHNAHRWQSYEVTRHFCRRAVALSPHIVDLMLSYIELQTRDAAPIHMSEAEEKILRVGSSLIHHYLYSNNDRRLDRILLGAIAEVLEEVGVPAQEQLDRIRREEYSLKDQETDLISYYFISAAQQPQEFEVIASPRSRLGYDAHYYRAFWPYSRFIFVGEAGCAVDLTLTCRLPKPAPREGKITIDCNGQPQVEINVSTDWTAWNISLPGQAVRDGLNEILVHWPMPEFRSAEALSKVTLQLSYRKFPDFYPVFGQIHSFKAGIGQPVATTVPVIQTESSFVKVA